MKLIKGILIAIILAAFAVIIWFAISLTEVGNISIIAWEGELSSWNMLKGFEAQRPMLPIIEI